MSQKRELKVDIYGKTYVIKDDAEEEYMMKVASYVDEKMKRVSSELNLVDSYKVAILAALQITDELFKAKENMGKKLKFNEEKAYSLLSLLENEIENIEDLQEKRVE